MTADERCKRMGQWGLDWRRNLLDDVEMLQSSIREAMLSTRRDFGEVAGEQCYVLGAEPGLYTKSLDSYTQVCHLACLADILSTAIRKPSDGPWIVPGDVPLTSQATWRSGAFLAPDGSHLRRVVLATSWSDDRHYSECRSWFSLGEVCVYNLPMKMAVCVIGKNRDFKRYSWWTRGLRHPMNKRLRFRKRNAVAEGFKASWEEIWREDHNEISTKTWLQTMLDDNVLKDCCFSVDIEVPDQIARRQIMDLAAQKLERIYKTKEVPEQNLSVCDLPRPCAFRNNCHRGDDPSGRYGLVRLD